VILAQAFARFVFDLDGVIWRGNVAIPGAPQTVRALRDAGKRVAFVTNNSGLTGERYAKKLSDMGAGGAVEEIVSSADATASLMQREIPGLRGRAVMIVGGEGLRVALEPLGVRIVEGEEARDASVVVVGIDRKLSYDKLKVATLAIRAGATFVASNTDATYPIAEGLIPGAGAIVAALVTATGVQPLVAGKPQPTLLEVAGKRLGGTPALMIGDRVDTDILAAQAAGWPSALVLTGATSVPDLAAAAAWPDFLLRKLSDLLADLPHAQVRPATGPDLPPIASLLHGGGLLSGAARERLGRTLVAESDRRPIATAAWEMIGGGALLRSVAVEDAMRRTGTGTLIVAAALRRILESGARDVYLLTENAAAFFAACGFAEIDRDDLPEELSEHPQVQRECTVAATVMHLRLPEPV
jgi:phosphoglycolate/pyridoxal phosphate phosphatase family enzyme